MNRVLSGLFVRTNSSFALLRKNQASQEDAQFATERLTLFSNYSIYALSSKTNAPFSTPFTIIAILCSPG